MSEQQAGVRNESSAAVGGHSVQAGEIHGGVHFHQKQPSPVVPRQLPGAAGHFTNRSLEKDWLTTLLNGPGTGDRLLISSIDGTAGIGKTTLAVHWAHGVREQFGDGELYVNLRGFDPSADPMTPRDALGTFLAALDVAPERVPDDVDARSALFRSLLHDKRVLVLLDNARTAEQVRPLLPASPTCLVLVTSRNRMQDLVVREGAQRMTLDLLTPAEARQLLAGHLGQDRLEAEPQAADAIVEHCAGLPLALGIVAYRAAEEPDFPLAELVAELRDEQARLDALDAGGQTGVRAVLSWSYRSLSDAAERMFRLLGLPTGDDISLAAAADLAGTTQRDARSQLSELTRAHLLDQHTPGRYRFHDLLRAYAAECAATDETPEQRTSAIRRLLDHYLRTSSHIEKSLVPNMSLDDNEPPESEIQGLQIEDRASGVEWWSKERANLVAAVQQANQVDLHTHAWKLALTLRYFLKIRSHTEDCLRCNEVALASARALELRDVEAHLLLNTGTAHYQRGEFESTASYQEQAQQLFKQVGDRQWEGIASYAVGDARLQAGDHEAAKASLYHALELHQQLDEEHSFLADIRAQIGDLCTTTGHVDEALTHLRAAHDLYQDSGETIGIGTLLNSFGRAHHRAGSLRDAQESYEQAVAYRKEIGDGRGEVNSLRELGMVLRDNGDSDGARELWQEALDRLEAVGDLDKDEIRAQLNQLTEQQT